MYDYEMILERLGKRIVLIPETMHNDVEEYCKNEKENHRVVEIHPTEPCPAVFEEVDKYKATALVVLRSTPGLREALLASGYEFILAGWTVPTVPEELKDEMIEWRDTQSDRIRKVLVSHKANLGDALSALAAYNAV